MDRRRKKRTGKLDREVGGTVKEKTKRTEPEREEERGRCKIGGNEVGGRG